MKGRTKGTHTDRNIYRNELINPTTEYEYNTHINIENKKRDRNT